jgi:hypothetical protein
MQLSFTKQVGVDGNPDGVEFSEQKIDPEAIKSHKDPLPSTNVFDLDDLFTDSITFHYEVKSIEGGTIKVVQGGDNTSKISVNLFVLLPLKFEIAATPVLLDGVSYKKLDLSVLDDLFPANEDGSPSDLFGRSGDAEESSDMDAIFDNLESVTIILNKLQNEIIGDLVLAVTNTNPTTEEDTIQLIDLNSKNTDPRRIEFNADEIGNPFAPTFALYVLADNLFTILRPDGDDASKEFDFSIAVEAKTAIDHTIDF